MGGCSTPIAVLATVDNNKILFKGNICSNNGEEKIDIELNQPISIGKALGWADMLNLI
jgi:porphobilinogen deaminase